MFRVGFGQDSHRFSDDKNRLLTLGGIKIEGEVGLLGNSDGDVIIHAICRAIEQAIGGESFSVYADKKCGAGILDSKKYLEISLENAKQKGYSINNLGISIEARKPRVDLIAAEMKRTLAKIMNIELSRIGISATSGENLTPFGKGEGIQAFAIISLIKK
ncbi:MAG: 2-C-methyl-D-erythritol 2,4-cyclodiphosphate synthase [Parcubacteria group bacterium]